MEKRTKIIELLTSVRYTTNDIEKVADEIRLLFDVDNCNCDEIKQLSEESCKIEHLINDTYQVVGEPSGTVWKQGSLEECNEYLMDI